jgi:hypothetical protein
MVLKLAALTVCFVILSSIGAEEGPKPESDETQLSADESTKTLEELATRFKANPRIKAHVVIDSEDPFGPRKDEGDMLLDRGGRLFEKFTKPALRLKLFDDMKLHEYAGKKKIDYIKDFSNAPKFLKLIQAVVTADIKELNTIFDIVVFTRASKDGSGSDLRLVLTQKSDEKSALKYKFIEGRIAAKGLFFDEIQYVQEGGDKIVEHYSDIQLVEAFKDDDFKLNLPAEAKSKVEVVGADGK